MSELFLHQGATSEATSGNPAVATPRVLHGNVSFYPPSAALADHVLGYVVRRHGTTPTPTSGPVHFPAHMLSTLTLVHHGQLLRSEAGDASTPQIAIGGARTRAVVRQYVDDTETTVVLFKPGRLADFCHASAHEFTDTLVDGRDVLTADEQTELVERMAEQPSVARQLHLLEGVLERRLAPTVHGRGLQLSRAVQRLIWEMPHMPVGVLGQHLGVSERQLRRVVARWFGVSPAMLTRLARLQLSLLKLQRATHAPEHSLAAIAAQCSFADAGHMARELKLMTGLTPAVLRTELHSPSHLSWAFELPQDLLHPVPTDASPEAMLAAA